MEWVDLLDRLFNKNIGLLLKPYIEYRTGIAKNKVKEDELIRMAQARKAVEDIDKGNAQFLLASQKRLTYKASSERAEPYIDFQAIEELTSGISLHDRTRQEVNVAKCIISAEETLIHKGVSSSVQGSETEDDWLYAWRDCASKVSNPDVQKLWGQVLAGEFTKTNSFSLRTLEFLRTITKQEALLIEKISNFEFHGFIFKGDEIVLKNHGLHFDELLKLQDMGIIDAVDGAGIGLTFKSINNSRFITMLNSDDSFIHIEGDDPMAFISIQSFYLNQVAREIMQLTNKVTPTDYLESICKNIESQGFRVINSGKKNIRK